MAAIAVDDLWVRYGALAAVRGVSFAVEQGSVLGLVGESGSGKSTVARAIVGLTHATGSIRVAGVEVLAGSARLGLRGSARLGLRGSARLGRAARRRVQLVFQDSRSSLDPRFTVGQCVLEGLDGRTGPGLRHRQSNRARVAELLELVSLDPAIARSRPADLSGGQRQRVAIARAIAARPDILIADEVTASLDVSVQAVVLNLLRRLRAELGLTMIFISHNLAVVRYMSDQLAVMFNGRIVEQGAVEAVIGQPEHPYTRSLLAAIPQIGQRRLLSDSSVETSAEIGELPATGCDYHPRCPVGPAADPHREICTTADPITVAAGRAHGAICHFARTLAPDLRTLGG
jgi:peptide/nickel transport system ATP-binding protein